MHLLDIGIKEEEEERANSTEMKRVSPICWRSNLALTATNPYDLKCDPAPFQWVFKGVV